MAGKKRKKSKIIALVVALLVVGWVVVFFAADLREKWFQQLRRTGDKNEIMNLNTAIALYKLEYGALPYSDRSGSDKQFEVEGDLLDALTGDAANDLNPRQKIFFEARVAKQEAGGMWRDGSGKLRLTDSYGRPYVVILDTDGDGKITPPGGGSPIGKESIGWSLGADPKDPADDIRSW